MDQQEFDAIMQRGKSIPARSQQAAQVAPSPQPASPAAATASPEAEPAIDFEALTGAAEAAGVELPDAAEVPVPPGMEGIRDAIMGQRAQSQQADEQLGQIPEAAATGVAKSVFETKDFLFGDTSPEDRSNFRATIEQKNAEATDGNILGGIASGIGQFAGAMFGLGKFSAVAKALPWYGRGLGFVASTKAGQVGLEVTKAAAAGFVAFDPWEKRLSNMMDGTPLAGTFFSYLAAEPDDSEWEGRFKAAAESIALDGVLLGTLMGGVKVWKHLRNGDDAAAQKAILEAENQRRAALKQEAKAGEVSSNAGGPAVDGAPTDSALVGDPSDATGTSPEAPTGEVGHAGGQPDAPQVGPTAQGVDTPNDEAAIAAMERATQEVNGGPSKAAETGAAGPEASVGVGGPTAVPDAKAAAGALGEELPNPRLGRIRVTDEDTTAVLGKLEEDAKALEDADGSFTKAVENGHTFGQGEGIPYFKLNSEVDVQNFVERLVERKQSAIDRAKGGRVLTDERVDKLTAKMVELYNEDPATVLATIQRAGKNAQEAVTMMETGYLVTSRMMQDAHALSARIVYGDYTGYGNREGAIAELRKLMTAASSSYAATKSITANSGRALRRMRMEFSVDPQLVANINSADGEELLKLMAATGGDPRKIAKVVNPTWYQTGMNKVAWLLVNNLVSGPKTQLINLMSNGYMLGVRPMERMIGAAVLRDSHTFKEASKQYAYFGTAAVDGFGLAAKAFLRNDSVLNPHSMEMFEANRMGAPAPITYKPWDSLGGIMENAFAVATRGTTAAVGAPTRILGTVDEMVKQVVYRSKVMAEGHMEALERMPAGLSKKGQTAFIKKYVRDRVDNSMDAQGRALDANALREAMVATFQQELGPATVGRTVQSAVFKHPGLKVILPFVKTPTNVLRYGWKMTPGLNLLQNEYRGMLMGRSGKEAQAQAVGQMALGTLYSTAAAFMVSQGTLSGGGPSDWQTRSGMMDTGWQEYSIVVERDDGTKAYIPYNRYDPVAMPMGIIADLQTFASILGEEDPQYQAAIGALALSLARQFTNKTYLTGVQDFMDVMSEPDETKVTKWLGRQASNLIPYSALMRQVNPDPYMRETRTMVDKMMATLPGWSEELPAKYDWLGEPKLMRKGLWSSDDDQLVDNEYVRMAMENDGNVITVPQPRHGNVDLRDLVMEDGKNAYEEYQRLAGKPFPSSPSLKASVAKLMKSEAYAKAPDGGADIKGTRLWMLSGRIGKYREAALKLLKRDPRVREAFGERQKKAIEHYQKLRGIQPRQPKPLTPMEKLGEAFNLGLGSD